MDGQAKVQLILELKDRLKTGLSEAKKKVNSTVSDMKGRLNSLKNEHVAAFTAMRNQIPLFGNAMEALGNPYVMIIGGLIAVGALIGKTTKDAAEFQSAFLPIKQLNMDKPVSEMERYEKTVKNTAFDIGANLKDTTNAFYDLQSGTGLFGDEAAEVLKKVGDYSLVTGAKLNDSVNATVKAMRAFGLDISDIDNLLLSNAKTVQMGIVTFDELAKVQTEYAGAAAGANQTIDTANKLFAAFTAVAKDANTGATMTKTAFEGLTQKNTIEGIEAMGVKMYDANNEMRDMSDIMKDVSTKFKGMSGREIDAAIARIGGPEGLRNLFIKLKTGADDFFNTLEGFDKSQFNFAQALKNAKGDMNIISAMAKNRLGVISAEIGQKFLPIWVSVLEKVNSALSFVWDNFDTIWSVIKNVGAALIAAKTYMLVFNAITAANPIGAIITGVVLLIGYITIAYKKWDEFGAAMLAALGPLGMILNIFLNMKKHWESIVDTFQNDGFLSGIKHMGLVLIDALVMPIQQLLTLIGKIPGLTIAKDWAGSVEEWRKNVLNIDTKRKLHQEDEQENQSTNPFATDDTTKDTTNNKLTDNSSSSINKITGSAKQIKSINISIDSFVKGGINTENTTLQNMDASQLEQWFTEQFLRVIRNVETSY